MPSSFCSGFYGRGDDCDSHSLTVPWEWRWRFLPTKSTVWFAGSVLFLVAPCSNAIWNMKSNLKSNEINWMEMRVLLWLWLMTNDSMSEWLSMSKMKEMNETNCQYIMSEWATSERTRNTMILLIWLIDRLIDWLIWLIDGLIDWLMFDRCFTASYYFFIHDSSIHWFIDSSLSNSGSPGSINESIEWVDGWNELKWNETEWC